MSTLHSYNEGEPEGLSRTELDSHADSPVVGRNAYILEYTAHTVNVHGFAEDLGNLQAIPVVHAIVAYDCPLTAHTYLLRIHNAIYIESMTVNLIPPFMMRLAGLVVNECPKIFSSNPSEEDHSVYFPDHELRLPLQLHHTTSYLPTRRPHQDELQTKDEVYNLTPDSPGWNPHDTTYSESESAMLDFNGQIRYPNEENKLPLVQVASTRMSNELPFEPDIVLNSISSTLTVPSLVKRVSALKISSKKGIKIADLAHLWKISKETAKRTIEASTQHCVRTSNHPTLARQFSTNDRWHRYPRNDSVVFMDTFFATKKSLQSKRGFKMAQIFATDFNFVHVQLMRSRSDLHLALKEFFKTFGVPSTIICDNIKEQIQGKARELCNLVSCPVVPILAYTPKQNRAELYVRIMKRKMSQALKITNAPMKLWCYLAETLPRIHNSTAHDHYLLKGLTPLGKMTGVPPDISHLCQFAWYEWVYYRDPAIKFPFNPMQLGRCLGASINSGPAMTQFVLKLSGEVSPYLTLRALTSEEKSSPEEKNKRELFTKQITAKLGDSMHIPSPADSDPSTLEYLVDESDPVPPYHEQVVSSHPEDFDDFDNFLQTEVLLPKEGEHMLAARVVRRSKDNKGKLIGKFNENPILNTRVYDVLFPDGSYEQYAANQIAENIYSQVDEEGRRYLMLADIIDHRTTNEALSNDDAYITSENGNRSRIKTTKGWEFLVQWRDGTESWHPLKDLKASNPVELAEYGCMNGIDNEPALAWWIPHTLKKRDRIISSIQSRLLQRSRKYGVLVPKNVTEAYEIDKINGNSYWRDAIHKEMTNVSVAFQFLGEDDKIPHGYRHMGTHLIFDVKMDFTRKARLVADGHKTAQPAHSTYAGVVSRESVRIALTYAALMDLDVLAADIQNAYLQAPPSEQFYTIAGPEWGSRKGQRMLIVRALYGGKSSGRDFRNHLQSCMSTMGFDHCESDHDVWRKAAVTDDGTEYYEYILLYVDDCLVVSHRARDILTELNGFFTLKKSSIGPPKIYLGSTISQVTLPNGVKAWASSSSQYVKEAVKNVEEYLADSDQQLMRHAKAPITANYKPELDQSEELDDATATYYQSLIGILRWIVEIGRVDICVEVSMLSSFLTNPREGHLQQVYHIFAFLKSHHNARLVFDPTYPILDPNAFTQCDWSPFYNNVKELIPENAPSPKGREFTMIVYVDADFAGDKLTRRSRTGFIVFLNSAPIYWYSKRQNSIETSSFGSEFVAMKHACEYVRSLRYHLRMMGIPVTDPTYIRGDNQSVLFNSSVPESILKKKHHSVAYHFVREGSAAGEWTHEYVNTKNNAADILASSRPYGEDRKRKVRMILYDIYDDIKESEERIEDERSNKRTRKS